MKYTRVKVRKAGQGSTRINGLFFGMLVGTYPDPKKILRKSL